MSTIYESVTKKLILFTKGAPDFLINICSSYISSTG
jgi:magnesium-transporting ATPase (P-type)